MTRRALLGFTMAGLVTMVGGALPLEAQQVTRPRAGRPGQWRLLGSVEAGFTADHDSIIVAGPNDWFRRIKFKVTDAGLNLKRLVVTYENGEPDRIDVREDIPEGGESRQIDLRGAGQRKIKRIDFWYDTKGILRGRANVTVFGMK
jgi:hypothetical protein